MRGFSTLEMMIAFAILALVLGGVVMADFGAQYWTITSQTSNEALYKAKVQLENLRASAKKDFYSATSSALALSHDASCDAGGLCYYLKTVVSDISLCSKYASTSVSWQVNGYPTTTTSLFTLFVSASSTIAFGGDCSLDYPAGDWTAPAELPDPISPRAISSAPTDIDALNDVAYIVESGTPSLEMANSQNVSSMDSYTAPDAAAFNAVDVARDSVTGRTYAYVAATSTQFRVIDVTSTANPVLVASSTLSGIPVGLGSGWRLFFYDRKIYIASNYINNSPSVPEFHIFDVGYPTSPTEVGSYKLTTAVYGISVRDQYVGGSLHRFAYLATTLPSGQLQVLDVTDSKNISTVATCPLPGNGSATSVLLLGNTLYVGLDVSSGFNDLYAFDATSPASASFCTPLGAANVDTGGYSRHVVELRGSGPYLFVATNNTTPARGEVQVRSTDPATNFALLGAYEVPDPTGTGAGAALYGMDFDGDTNRLYLVAAKSGISQFRVLTAGGQ